MLTNNNFEVKEAYLIPNFDSRKSFYKKAILRKFYKNNLCYKVELISYSTTVASIENNKLYIKGLYSNTTIRHIKEFLCQYYYNFDSSTKDIFKSGINTKNIRYYMYESGLNYV